VTLLALGRARQRVDQRPINRQLTAAAHDGRIPGDTQALQRRWDHVINARAALQTVAVAGLCAALILS
jgi:hypothetical protein